MESGWGLVARRPTYNQSLIFQPHPLTLFPLTYYVLSNLLTFNELLNDNICNFNYFLFLYIVTFLYLSAYFSQFYYRHYDSTFTNFAHSYFLLCQTVSISAVLSVQIFVSYGLILLHSGLFSCVFGDLYFEVIIAFNLQEPCGPTLGKLSTKDSLPPLLGGWVSSPRHCGSFPLSYSSEEESQTQLCLPVLVLHHCCFGTLAFQWCLSIQSVSLTVWLPTPQILCVFSLASLPL